MERNFIKLGRNSFSINRPSFHGLVSSTKNKVNSLTNPWVPGDVMLLLSSVISWNSFSASVMICWAEKPWSATALSLSSPTKCCGWHKLDPQRTGRKRITSCGSSFRETADLCWRSCKRSHGYVELSFGRCLDLFLSSSTSQRPKGISLPIIFGNKKEESRN